MLRLEMLGGLRVTVRGHGVVARFRTRKAASLLCYLALHPGRQHSREFLADRFWPDADFDAARVSLRTALSHLRKDLGVDGVLTSDGNRALALTDVSTDVADFEAAVAGKRWAEARRLYAGELLPGFWDEWVVDERERLDALFEEVCRHAPARPTPSPTPLALPTEHAATPLIGRDDGIETIGGALAEVRLLTLIGPGGIGKTRLAIAAAARHAARFPGGIWFVPLAALRDGRALLPAVRDALGLPRTPRGEPAHQIATFLTGDAPVLVVLDNLEQLAAGAAGPVRTLLDAVPNLRIVVTTRRRLGVPGERQMRVAPLDDASGVRLFVERACEAAPDFVPTPEIAPLCRELDNLPLAIELAAARCGSLTVAQIRTRLSERLALLATRRHDKSARHRSLDAAIDWSFQLLTPEQRRLFTRLSVFRGGWTTEAAEAVCDEPNAVEYLAQLRERSLIHCDADGRWSMLESLRAFAHERHRHDAATIAHRHTRFFLDLARRSARTPRAIAAEIDNFRAALARTDAGSSHAELAVALYPYWHGSGDLDEGVRELRMASAHRLLSSLLLVRGEMTAALAAADTAVAEAVAAGDAGEIALSFGMRADALIGLRRIAEARDAAAESLRRAKETGNTAAEQNAHNALGQAAYFADRPADAAQHFATALAIATRRGDDESVLNQTGNIGITWIERGDLPQARRWVGDALQRARDLEKDAQIALQSGTLSVICAWQGDWDAARAAARESARRAHAIPALLTVRNALWVLGWADVATGENVERGALLWGAVQTLCEATGTPMLPDDLARQDGLNATIRAAIGDARFESLVAEGRTLSRDAAVARALDAVPENASR